VHATASMIALAAPAVFVAAPPPSVSAAASVAHACVGAPLSSPRSTSDRWLDVHNNKVVYSGSNALSAQATSVAVLRRVVRSTPLVRSRSQHRCSGWHERLYSSHWHWRKAAVQSANQLHHCCRHRVAVRQPLALEAVLRAALQSANQLHHCYRGCPPPGELHPQTPAPLVTKRVPKSAAHRRIQRSVIVSHARCRAAQAQHPSGTAAQNQRGD
jgi:hypothetical protein